MRAHYLGHVTGYQPIRDQYFLIRSVPANYHAMETARSPTYVQFISIKEPTSPLTVGVSLHMISEIFHGLIILPVYNYCQ